MNFQEVVTDGEHDADVENNEFGLLLRSVVSFNGDDYRPHERPQPPPLIKKPSHSQPNNEDFDIVSMLVRQPSLIYQPIRVPSRIYDHRLQLIPDPTPLQASESKPDEEQIVVPPPPPPPELPKQAKPPSVPARAAPIEENSKSKSESHRRKRSQHSRSRSKDKTPYIPCTCTKTHCLKMYCSCFHNGRKCQSECKCEECKNLSEYDEDIKKAIEHVKQKAHRTHQPNENDLFNTEKFDACNCRKTHCVKRYCECFIRKKKCTEKCNCEDCENGKDDDIDIYNKGYSSRRRSLRRRRSSLES